MKKIGEYTARGQYHPDGGFNLDNPDRIQLFDGSFDTADKITSFHVWGTGIYAGQDNDVLGVLTTEDLGTITMDGGDNRQVAWASNRGGTYADVNALQKGIIDPNNLIIEDLFIYGFAGDQGSSVVNYMITFEKYKLEEFRGTLAMIHNQSQ